MPMTSIQQTSTRVAITLAVLLSACSHTPRLAPQCHGRLVPLNGAATETKVPAGATHVARRP